MPENDAFDWLEFLHEFGVSLHCTPFNWKFYYDIQSDCAWSFKLGPVGLTIWFN